MFVSVGNRKIVETLIYCQVCDPDQPLLIDLMNNHAGANDEVHGDLLCGVCKFITATVAVPARGKYRPIKVADSASGTNT